MLTLLLTVALQTAAPEVAGKAFSSMPTQPGMRVNMFIPEVAPVKLIREAWGSWCIDDEQRAACELATVRWLEQEKRADIREFEPLARLEVALVPFELASGWEASEDGKAMFGDALARRATAIAGRLKREGQLLPQLAAICGLDPACSQVAGLRARLAAVRSAQFPSLLGGARFDFGADVLGRVSRNSPNYGLVIAATAEYWRAAEPLWNEKLEARTARMQCDLREAQGLADFRPAARARRRVANADLALQQLNDAWVTPFVDALAPDGSCAAREHLRTALLREIRRRNGVGRPSHTLACEPDCDDESLEARVCVQWGQLESALDDSSWSADVDECLYRIAGIRKRSSPECQAASEQRIERQTSIAQVHEMAIEAARGR